MPRESSLERDYYSKIYLNSQKKDKISQEDSILNEDSNHLSSRTNRLSFSLNENTSFSTSFTSRNSFNSCSTTMPFSDDTDTMMNSLRRLGIESASIASLANIRNNSYLKSREDDCIETILLLMQPKEDESKKASKKSKSISVIKEEDEIEEKNKLELIKSKNRLPKALKKLLPKSFKSESAVLIVDETMSKSNADFDEKKNKIKKILKFNFCVHFFTQPIESQSKIYLVWLAIVSIIYVYNIFCVTSRFAFKNYLSEDEMFNNSFKSHNNSNSFDLNTYFDSFINSSNKSLEYKEHELSLYEKRDDLPSIFIFIADFISDLVYLLDIFFIQMRIKFLKDGLWISDLKSTRMNYIKSLKFKV